MVTLEKIRSDLAELQKKDQSIKSVEVHADVAVTAGVDHHRVNYRLDMTVKRSQMRPFS